MACSFHLSYSPGTLYQLPPGKYFPGLPEWGIAIGIIGYALTMLTLGVKYLATLRKRGTFLIELFLDRLYLIVKNFLYTGLFFVQKIIHACLGGSESVQTSSGG